jgi:hypothetical protein
MQQCMLYVSSIKAVESSNMSKRLTLGFGIIVVLIGLLAFSQSRNTLVKPTDIQSSTLNDVNGASTDAQIIDGGTPLPTLPR